MNKDAETRPRADRAWLLRLRREGLAALLPSPPEPLAGFYQGVREFNDGLYRQAHETLEAVWLGAPYPVRLFYYGLIKLAVGLLHLQAGNSVGARQQLRVAVEFLEPFSPRFLGIRTDLLRRGAQARLRVLQREPKTGRHAPLRIRRMKEFGMDN